MPEITEMSELCDDVKVIITKMVQQTTMNAPETNRLRSSGGKNRAKNYQMKSLELKNTVTEKKMSVTASERTVARISN